MKHRCGSLIFAASIIASAADAGDDRTRAVDDDLGPSRTVVFDDRDDREDGVQLRVDKEGKILVVPPRTLPEPYEALKALAERLEVFAATSKVDHGAEIVEVLDVIDLVETGEQPFPESLCIGGDPLMQMIDDQLALEREPDRSDAGLAKSALQDVCVLVPQYWTKQGNTPTELFLSAEALGDLARVDFTFCAAIRPRVVVPLIPGALEQYPIEAYMLNGSTAVIEEGQRITAAGCKGHVIQNSLPGSSWVEYGLRLTFVYGVNSVDEYVSTTSNIGAPLPDGIVIPDQIGSTPGTLEWMPVQRECISDSCTDTDLLSHPNSVPLKVVSRGAMCEADYKYNQFAINDRNDVNPAFEWYGDKVTSISGDGIGDNAIFKAYAHVPVGAPTSEDPVAEDSTWPTWMRIAGGQRFAVHADDDPISIYDHTHSRAEIIAQMGTAELSALRFPRVESTGSATGVTRKRSYSCHPPSLQRDFVAFCTANAELEPTDSKYLLPFHGTSQIWAGNYAYDVPGAPHTSETERYAWDFVTKWMDDDHMYAARSGVVITVTQNHDGGTYWSPGCQKDDPSHPGQMIDSDCDNNRIVVLHQDGTSATYQHGKHHGAVVSVGDIVKRGDNLGESGCVGHCGEQHIHFDVHESKLDEHMLHNLRVPRAEDPMPTHSNHLSIPATFDRESDVCNVPPTAALPHSTLTPGDIDTDAGGPVYTTHIDNEYNLPNKRKISQSMPPRLVLDTGTSPHTAQSTAYASVDLTIVDQIPLPLSISFTHDGTNQVDNPSDHHSSGLLAFPAPPGWSNHALTVTVFDGNGHAYATTTNVAVFMDPLYDANTCASYPNAPHCN